MFEGNPLIQMSGEVSYFEPLLNQIFIHFSKLIKAYQAQADTID